MTDKDKIYNSFINLLTWIMPGMKGYELEFSENFEAVISEEVTLMVDTSGDVVDSIDKEIDITKAIIGEFNHDTLEVNIYILNENYDWEKDFKIEELLELTNLFEIVEDYLTDCRAIKDTKRL